MKKGFSVVAPIRTMTPFSTSSSSTSCWARLKRCSSSMNSTVRRPAWARVARARSMIARTSLTDAPAALSLWNAAETCRAITNASVVLPVPGGP